MDSVEAIIEEFEIEKLMRGNGVARFHKNVDKAVEKAQESKTGYGMLLHKTKLEQLKEGIERYLKQYTGKKGRTPIAHEKLSKIDSEKSAFIILKNILDGISRVCTFTQCAMRVASSLEDELRFQHFERKNGDLFKRTFKYISKATSYRHKRNAMSHAMNVASENDIEMDWQQYRWSKTVKEHVGICAINLCLQATGLIEITKKSGGKKTTYLIEATDELFEEFSGRNYLKEKYIKASGGTEKWIEEKKIRAELLKPAFLPTVIKPKTWIHPFSGGYHDPSMPKLPMVKTRESRYLEELSNMAHEMRAVYDSINIMQNTAWKINQPVLKVLDQIIEKGLVVGKLPSFKNLDLPPRPFDIATNEEARNVWKRQASKIHAENRKMKSKRLQVLRTISIAEDYKHRERFYFPYQLDFRGRVYAIPMFLTPQSVDYAKALLTFADGQRMGDVEDAPQWLAIHIANCFGLDKDSMEERVKWVNESSEAIIAIATDPIGNFKMWRDADSPFAFLASCFEYKGYQEMGDDFITTLPIAMDATCSGLQHFSAIQRDAVTAEATNLLPQKIPSDIYQIVADKVTEKLKLKAEFKKLARDWLEFGVDRKCTKRPIMVLPYGGTKFSTKDYVKDYIQEKGKPHNFGEDVFMACVFLTDVIWDSIGETAKSAREVMTWLQKVSRLVASENLPVVWTTPAGFPVQQIYKETESRRVKSKLGDNIIKLNIQLEKDDFDRRRMSNSISPNWIHSLDACCLQLSVVKAHKQGIKSFAMVHDSYGCLATQTSKMGVVLREVFVDMYKEDVLAKFRDEIVPMLNSKNQAKVPPLPEKGDLDINKVLESDYFFC